MVATETVDKGDDIFIDDGVKVSHVLQFYLVYVIRHLKFGIIGDVQSNNCHPFRIVKSRSLEN